MKLPKEFQDNHQEERSSYEHRRRRLDEARRSAEDRALLPESSREDSFDDRYDDKPYHRQEGRNYRKELLERFADVDLEDQRDHYSHQRYYE